MSLRVYNTLSKQKEPFTTVQPGKVGIYLCGPTVYKSPHIGHMVGPVIFDAISRYLTFRGYDVTLIVNVTDVDDKIIETANNRNSTTEAISEQYTKEYFDVLASLGIDTISHFPRASGHMKEIIDIIGKLIDRGHAYATDGNVWFDVLKDPDYGKLSNRKVEDQESGLRTLQGDGKKNPADFSLWKAAKAGEPAWDSPWGKGRPGWHIECTAMSIKYLGETFDIHGGGMDLMFPHHENELAQSECCTGKTFARYWMHNGLTKLRTKLSSGEWSSEKMSGSIGNVVNVTDLLRDHGAELIRYLLLSTHYRSPIDFGDAVVVASKKGLSTFSRLFERIARLGPDEGDKSDINAISAVKSSPDTDALVKAVSGLRAKFTDSMDDDFNTAGAIGVLHEIASEINSFIEKSGAEKSRKPEAVQAIVAATRTLRGLAGLLGMFRGPLETPKESSSPAQVELADDLMKLIIELRASARTKKDFATSDAIRDGLKKLSITLEDRADGTGWRRN